MFHVKHSPMVLGWMTLFHVEHPWSKRLATTLKREKIAIFLFLLDICSVREFCLVENRNYANFTYVFLEFLVP